MSVDRSAVLLPRICEIIQIIVDSRENDLEINALRAKQLTNVRASGKDEAVRLAPPRLMSLEQAIAYIQDDERVEVTPKSIRLRKALLDRNDRKREERKAEKM